MLENSALQSAVSSTFLRVRLLIVPDMHIEPCDGVTEGQGRPAQVRQDPMMRANHNASCIEGISDSFFALLCYCATAQKRLRCKTMSDPNLQTIMPAKKRLFSGLKDRDDTSRIAILMGKLGADAIEGI